MYLSQQLDSAVSPSTRGKHRLTAYSAVFCLNRMSPANQVHLERCLLVQIRNIVQHYSTLEITLHCQRGRFGFLNIHKVQLEISPVQSPHENTAGIRSQTVTARCAHDACPRNAEVDNCSIKFVWSSFNSINTCKLGLGCGD